MSRRRAIIDLGSGARSLKQVSNRLVLVTIEGQTPLLDEHAFHWPPIESFCSKSTGSNPCCFRNFAVTRPPGPLPTIATLGDDAVWGVKSLILFPIPANRHEPTAPTMIDPFWKRFCIL